MNQIAAKLQRPFKQIINESEILNLNKGLQSYLKKMLKIKIKIENRGAFQAD